MEQKTTIQISVIITAYNAGRYLEACLESLLDERAQNFEIIVIDDASTDNTEDILKKFRGRREILTIEHDRNLGAAASRNEGVARANGTYLFFVDSDTQTHTGWSSSIPHFFESHPTCAVGQVKLLKATTNKFDTAGDLLSTFYFLVERARGAEDRGQFDKPSKIFSGKSAGMIVRSDIFKKLGGFDETFHIFYEDTDFCFSAWTSGYEMYFIPQIVVEHQFVTSHKHAKYYRDVKVIYRGCRNTITSLIKHLETKKLILKLPIHIAVWAALAGMMLIRGKVYECTSILGGILWNFWHISDTMVKRKTIQNMRRVSDKHIFETVGVSQGIAYYFHKGVAYIKGQPY